MKVEQSVLIQAVAMAVLWAKWVCEKVGLLDDRSVALWAVAKAAWKVAARVAQSVDQSAVLSVDQLADKLVWQCLSQLGGEKVVKSADLWVVV